MAASVLQHEAVEKRKLSLRDAAELEPFIPAWIRDDVLPACTPLEWMLLSIYISRADAGGVAWPSLGGLCKATGYGRVTVKKARRGLVSKRLLIPMQQRHVNGRLREKPFRLWYGTRTQ